MEGEYCGGKILYEEAFPNILFAVDGEIYNFDGYKCIVIGGAYSVDKHYRLAHGWHWWPDEQPDEEIKAVVEARLAALHWNIDIVLSHTCPRKYEPTEVFLSGLDQSSVDKSTEDWLDGIEDRLDYKNGTAATTIPGNRSTKYNSCSRTLTRCLFVYNHRNSIFLGIGSISD